MKNKSIKIKDINDSWFSEELCAPVSVRIMNDQVVNFHKHDDVNEMFLVISGKLFIDIKEKDSTGIDNYSFDGEYKTIELTPNQSYTVLPGTEHRTRVVGRAELMVIGGDKDLNLNSFGVTPH